MESNTSLKKNVAGLWAGVFQSLAYVAPAATAASFFVVEAGVAGGAVPLTFILASLGVASAMYMNYEFSRRISHAGGYYSYVSAGLGGRLGAFSGWLYYVNVLGALVGFSVLFFAGVAWPLVPGLASNPYGWLPLALIPIVLIFTLLYFGLKPSLYYTMIGAIIEVVFIVTVSLFIIFSPKTNNTFAPFTAMSASAGQLGLATVYAILGFVGLGSVITLSEELGSPKKVIPKAIILALLIGGITYILSSYAMVVGWGLNLVGGPGLTGSQYFANANNPGFTVVRNYLGPIAASIFIIITLNSFISNGIAEGNTFTRLGYALARDKVLFGDNMTKTHQKTGSPRKIVLFDFILVSVLSIIAGLVFKGNVFLAATVITTVNGASLYIVHVMANISLPIYGGRKLKMAAKKWAPFVLGPLPATAVYIYALYGVFDAAFSGIDIIIDALIILAVVIGIAIAVMIHSRMKESDIARIGQPVDVEAKTED